MARTTSLVIILLIVLLGCSIAPSEKTVAGAITDYFENRLYRVVDLKVGKIEGMPLSQKHIWEPLDMLLMLFPSRLSHRKIKVWI